jgi:heat-inducible transcriptional repressor
MKKDSLEKRRQGILGFVISSYIETASPVGSSTVSQKFNRRFSSATIRKDMADLEELGLLRQPHTSAGRVPTDQGYRYYVDRLMQEEPVPSQMQIDIAQRMSQGTGSIEEILWAASRVLSMMTEQAGFVVFPDSHEDPIVQVQLTPISRNQVLGNWVLSSGAVSSRMIQTEEALDTSTVRRISDYLNERVRGFTFDQMESFLDQEIEKGGQTIARLNQLSRVIWDKVSNSFFGSRILLEGYRNIMNQPEFRDVIKLRSLIGSLEDKQELLQILRRDIGSEEVRTHIGGEDFSDSLSDCSMVTANYVLNGRPAGMLGVIGPRRMSYPKVLGACRYMAHVVGGVLGSDKG